MVGRRVGAEIRDHRVFLLFLTENNDLNHLSALNLSEIHTPNPGLAATQRGQGDYVTGAVHREGPPCPWLRSI